jgi:parallel beta-helix repeat protein
MLQIRNVNPDRPATDYIIRGNFFDAGDTRSVQTIFMRNKRAEGTGDLDLYYKNILIEDNVIYNGHWHGISVGETVGLTIQNNTILHNPLFKNAPQIRLLGPVLDKTIEDNILHKFNTRGQFLVQDTDPNAVSYYGDLFVNALEPGATLDDLRALPDGLIKRLGVGAEMTRSGIDITLEAGPAAMVPR